MENTIFFFDFKFLINGSDEIGIIDNALIGIHEIFGQFSYLI